MKQRFINLTNRTRLVRSDNRYGSRGVVELVVPDGTTLEGCGQVDIGWSLTDRTLSLVGEEWDEGVLPAKHAYSEEYALWVLCDAVGLFPNKMVDWYCLPFEDCVLFCLCRGHLQVRIPFGEWVDLVAGNIDVIPHLYPDPVRTTWDMLPNLLWNSGNPMIKDGLYHFRYTFHSTNHANVSHMKGEREYSTPLNTEWLEMRQDMDDRKLQASRARQMLQNLLHQGEG